MFNSFLKLSAYVLMPEMFFVEKSPDPTCFQVNIIFEKSIYRTVCW